MTTTTQTEPTQELAVIETRALFLPQEKFPAMQEELAIMLPEIQAEIALADAQVVNTQDDADMAGVLLEKLADRSKLVVSKTKPFTQIAYKLHKWLTGYEGQYVKPIDAAYEQLKGKRNRWEIKERQEAERKRAEAQAILDREARQKQEAIQKEIERKQQEAANAKRSETAEKKRQEIEALREQAASVVPGVVHVEAAKPTTGPRSQLRWAVDTYDMTKMGIPLEIQGYVTIETGKLQRAKAANTMLVVKGVVFTQKLV